MSHYLYDTNRTRLHLVKSVPGAKVINWLFLPGGPGVDSSSLADLVKQMNLPGNYWLVDLIFNGTNENYPRASDDIYQQWPQYLESVVDQFENPILVGHSFGGYLPFFCPNLEQSLKGLIILNSIPTLKSDLFAKAAEKHNLPSLAQEKDQFIKEPNLATMKALYLKEAEYFFTQPNRAKGIETIVNKLEFCLHTEHWWYAGGYEFYSDIKWIPEQTATLIVGGSDDFITPFGVFEQDQRFHRKNIQMTNIPNAGHFPWMEQPDLINQAMESFVESYNLV